MPLRELSVLYDITRDQVTFGVQAANTDFAPAAAAGNGELDTNEVAEIVFAEVFSPINLDGSTDDLANIRIILDGKDTREWVRITGRNDTIMTPPVNRTQNNAYVGSGEIYTFGMGLADAMAQDVPALANTTLKYKRTVRIISRAGAVLIDRDYRIRLWGYRYFSEELPRLVPGGVMPGNFQIVDAERDRRKTIPYPTIPVTIDNWTILPGGADQGLPRVMPFARFAINAVATTLNRPYQFRFDTGNVAEEEQDMFFEYDIENKALIIDRLGVRRPLGVAGTWNMGEAWITVTGDALHEEHPKNRIPVTEFNNPVQFGNVQPLLPATMPLYYPIPRFQGTSLPIFDERAFVAIQDDGTAAVAIGGAVVAITGVIVELETGIIRPA